MPCSIMMCSNALYYAIYIYCTTLDMAIHATCTCYTRT